MLCSWIYILCFHFCIGDFIRFRTSIIFTFSLCFNCFVIFRFNNRIIYTPFWDWDNIATPLVLNISTVLSKCFNSTILSSISITPSRGSKKSLPTRIGTSPWMTKNLAPNSTSSIFRGSSILKIELYNLLGPNLNFSLQGNSKTFSSSDSDKAF